MNELRREHGLPDDPDGNAWVKAAPAGTAANLPDDLPDRDDRKGMTTPEEVGLLAAILNEGRDKRLLLDAEPPHRPRTERTEMARNEPGNLTARDRQLAALLASGLTREEAGAQLNLSVSTVRRSMAKPGFAALVDAIRDESTEAGVGP